MSSILPKLTILVFSFFQIQIATAKNCFTEHLHEAIQINSSRQLVYAKHLSGLDRERSLFVSRSLIFSEKILAWSIAPGFDKRSRQLELKHGFNVTCSGFISMQHIGSMKGLPKILSTNEFKKIDIASAQFKLKQMSEDRDFLALLGLQKSLSELLSSMSSLQSNCMLRHMVESIQRFVEIGLLKSDLMKRDPEFKDLVWDLIDLQISGLVSGDVLDRIAAPVQKRGVPIICNDVPAIPSLLKKHVSSKH
jgi:hypothetical protein